ncbi:hypothetical protein KM043_013237 [Ampulex compressa]|nr:hypothetical protein KM043_013237 [Ampulex compressa]
MATRDKSIGDGPNWTAEEEFAAEPRCARPRTVEMADKRDIVPWPLGNGNRAFLDKVDHRGHEGAPSTEGCSGNEVEALWMLPVSQRTPDRVRLSYRAVGS